MILRYGTLFTATYLVTTAWAQTPKITVKYLERQEKIQADELNQINSRARLENSQVDIDQQQWLCDHLRNQARRGHVQQNEYSGCIAQLSLLEVQAARAAHALTMQQLNHEISTIMLAGESGLPMDAVRVGELYVAKREADLVLIEAEIKYVQDLASRAEDYREYAERIWRKGYISEQDYRKAVNEVAKAKNDALGQTERKQRIELHLEQDRHDLAVLRGNS